MKKGDLWLLIVEKKVTLVFFPGAGAETKYFMWKGLMVMLSRQVGFGREIGYRVVVMNSGIDMSKRTVWI